MPPGARLSMPTRCSGSYALPVTGITLHASEAPECKEARVRRLTCSMGVSLDGYIVGPDGGFEWSAPDEEVFRFATDEVRQVGVHLLGRRLYETMRYWKLRIRTRR